MPHADWHIEEGCSRKGRRVIAAKNFSVGQLVLEDVPYAFALFDDQLEQRCDCCLQQLPFDKPLR